VDAEFRNQEFRKPEPATLLTFCSNRFGFCLLMAATFILSSEAHGRQAFVHPKPRFGLQNLGSIGSRHWSRCHRERLSTAWDQPTFNCWITACRSKLHVDDDLDNEPVSVVVAVEKGRMAALEFDQNQSSAPLIDLF